jgi:hypothetical protein
MARTYKLDHFTKGTGAAVTPVDDEPTPTPERGLNRVRIPRERRAPARPVERTATKLPAGHVRKKATGEIGRVVAVDAKAGTADVLWLHQGRTSTVPLTAITRR